MVIQTYVFFCDQTHGRNNKLPIKLIIFSLRNIIIGIIKQIMTGPSGNRLSICPLRFRIASQKFLLTSAAPQSIETLGEAILNLLGQIDLPITLEISHYLFNILVAQTCLTYGIFRSKSRSWSDFEFFFHLPQ